jgi:membrane protease subunit HflK
MAWNESGGNNSGGNRNPWGNRPDKGPPDLDEVVRNLQRKLSALLGLGAGGRKPGRPGGVGAGLPGGMRGLGIGTLVAVLLVIWALTGLYRVDAAERAVILRFGRYVGTAQPGLNWRLPWPIESKQVVNIASIESFSDQTRMLTSDENMVDINLAVQFRRADPLPYVFNVRDPEATLREVSESAIREIVGRSLLDAVLVAGRQEIAARTKELIQRTLTSYRAGIEITSVNLQGVSVPEQVAPSQQDAIKAREDRERLSLEAQTYANDILPKARGAAARQIQDAQGYRARKIADAEGESQRFTKLLAEYEQAPAVTRERLYIETIEEVFRGSKKVLLDTRGTGNMIYVPIDKLIEQGKALQRDAPRESAVTVTRSGGQGAQDGSVDDRRMRGTR